VPVNWYYIPIKSSKVICSSQVSSSHTEVQVMRSRSNEEVRRSAMS